METLSMESHDVAIRALRVLRGPNLYAYMPVSHIILDIGPYEDRPSHTWPGFVDRLTAWLPDLHTHQCGLGYPGGFIKRLQRGTYLPHICEHVTLALQNLMGFDVAFGRARGTGEPGVYRVVIAYQEEEPARAAFATALRLTLAAMHDEPFDFAAELEQLQHTADLYRLGPSTAAVVKAARARKIPVLRLLPTESLVQLGYGVHQKRIRASETCLTSEIAVGICQEKPLTNALLRAVGVPVPEGLTVRSAEAAWHAAQELGVPVVIKPDAGSQGKGVSVNLTSEDAVRAAYAIAADYGQDVLVEQYIAGKDFRLLVVNGAMVAAAQRDPAAVIGNGQHTIRQLVDALNQDPRRRPGHSGTLSQIMLNDAVTLALQQQHLTFQSIPAPGQVVRLRDNGNLSTGGTATDVTDDVHPSNARLAGLAAQILGLDVAGIDVVCQDIRRPLREPRGAIVEVNAAPGLRMHLYPTHGQGRDVGGPIVEMLYPQHAPSRIPIIAVTGTNGKTTVTRLVSHMYETAHRVVGMTCTEGTFIDQECILTGDCSGPRSARAVLLHPRVEVAVLETARGGILREGLAFDYCDVGIVTNVSADHLGLDGINTLEDLAQVKQVVVEVMHRDGAAVLNAEDPLVAEMAAATEARVVYFSSSPEHHVMAAHLATGGWGVYLDNNTIVLAQGTSRIALVELARVPVTVAGALRFQVLNAQAATAAAWAAGLNPAIIARALTTFTTDANTVPGRFNVQDIDGVQVILDYAHNAAALAALGEAVQALGARRTVLVLGLPGDRRDEDLQAAIVATRTFADAYVLHDLRDRRERAAYEVPRLLYRDLPAHIPCISAPDQPAAIQRAWDSVQRGDRLIVIADIVEESLQTLHTLAEGASAATEVPCPEPVMLEPVACPAIDLVNAGAVARGPGDL
jgi:cyanophycin synthetase